MADVRLGICRDAPQEIPASVGWTEPIDENGTGCRHPLRQISRAARFQRLSEGGGGSQDGTSGVTSKQQAYFTILVLPGCHRGPWAGKKVEDLSTALVSGRS